MPVAQKYELTDQVPYSPSPAIDVESGLKRAYEQRPEFLAAQARNHALELAVKAARGELLPTVQINGDYGVLGKSFQQSGKYIYVCGRRAYSNLSGRTRTC